MKARNIIIVKGCLLFFVFFAFFTLFAEKRVITLAPALTEVVFSLGKGHLIVGNTRYCDFPADAKKITHVGGLADLNLELLVSLKPDIIFFYPESYQFLYFLKKTVKLVPVRHETLEDLFLSIKIVSNELGILNEGNNLIRSLKSDLFQFKQIRALKKKCLIIIGRSREDLRNIYILGRKNFLNEIMDICGGINAYQGSLSYPNVSLESILTLNPDIIFEISAYYEGIDPDKLFAVWRQYPMINAVKKKKIYFITDSAWLRPSPRVGEIAKQMSSIISHD